MNNDESDELATVQALDVIAQRRGIPASGEDLFEAALNNLERRGVIERVDGGYENS